jgi:hypothetical protein
MTSFSWFTEICEKEDKKEMINLYCKKHLYVKKDSNKRQRVTYRGADPEPILDKKLLLGKLITYEYIFLYIYSYERNSCKSFVEVLRSDKRSIYVQLKNLRIRFLY